MPDTTRRNFLIGAGALAAAIAAPIDAVVKTIEVFAPPVERTLFIVTDISISKMSARIRAHAIACIGKSVGVGPTKLDIGDVGDFTLKYAIRMLYGQSQFPVSMWREHITVEFDISPAQALSMHLCDLLDLVMPASKPVSFRVVEV